MSLYLEIEIDGGAAPALPDGLCCDAFRRGEIAASLADPRCCMRCWPARRSAQLAARYAWRPAPFGRIRRVPPWQARCWNDEDGRR